PPLTSRLTALPDNEAGNLFPRRRRWGILILNPAAPRLAGASVLPSPCPHSAATTPSRGACHARRHRTAIRHLRRAEPPRLPRGGFPGPGWALPGRPPAPSGRRPEGRQADEGHGGHPAVAGRRAEPPRHVRPQARRPR